MVDLYGGIIITTKADIWVRLSTVVIFSHQSLVAVIGDNVDSFNVKVMAFQHFSKNCIYINHYW